MSDAIGSLVDLLVSAVLWRAVSELMRDQPVAVVLGVAAVAVVVFLSRRRPRPSVWSSDRPLTRGPRR